MNKTTAAVAKHSGSRVAVLAPRAAERLMLVLVASAETEIAGWVCSWTELVTLEKPERHPAEGVGSGRLAAEGTGTV